MVKVNVRGENIEVTDAIKSYLDKKISKIDKYFKDDEEITVRANLKVYKSNGTKVEMTIPLKSIVIRAEVKNDDLYAGIDLVVDKIERQIRKYKTRINKKTLSNKEQQVVMSAVESSIDSEIDENTPENSIVRVKKVSLKPMSAEEATLQMTMLGHTFFVFEDAETNGISVVYSRDDGTYGLIETNE